MSKLIFLIVLIAIIGIFCYIINVTTKDRYYNKVEIEDIDELEKYFNSKIKEINETSNEEIKKHKKILEYYNKQLIKIKQIKTKK